MVSRVLHGTLTSHLVSSLAQAFLYSILDWQSLGLECGTEPFIMGIWTVDERCHHIPRFTNWPTSHVVTGSGEGIWVTTERRLWLVGLAPQPCPQFQPSYFLSGVVWREAQHPCRPVPLLHLSSSPHGAEGLGSIHCFQKKPQRPVSVRVYIFLCPPPYDPIF